jgi:2-polyprenyl-3-methyl-5-hydroxy-6-metoxy-1,4-benzoquinol methylase
LEKSEASPAGSGEAAATQPCRACDCVEYSVLFEGGDRFYRTTDKRFQIVECRRCRLIRLFPQPEPAELWKYYPSGYWFQPEQGAADRLEQVYRRIVIRDHLRFVKHALAEARGEGFVLDVGCGGGLFLSMLAESGVPVVGLDFSLDAASVAWHREKVPTVCATLSRAPFAPGSCAAITMFHVLEHLYDPPLYIEAAHALLSPHGRLIVQVPNAASWQFLMLGENWIGVDVPRHLVTFRASDIEALLESYGFEIVRRKFFSLRDNPAGLASSLAPWLDPMARRLRGIAEKPNVKLLKDLVYFCLVAACLPLTLLEAACRAGSTIMVEARKKA